MANDGSNRPSSVARACVMFPTAAATIDLSNSMPGHTKKRKMPDSLVPT